MNLQILSGSVHGLAYLGRHGRWVLPGGLLAGMLLPWAAQPLRHAIPVLIGLLLVLALLRILSSSDVAKRALAASDWLSSLGQVLLAQLLLPVLVYCLLTGLGAPSLWVLAAVLVAAAPPISGSPNLVLLLGGDAVMSMRWLMLGTTLMPLSCLPILYLLFPAQTTTMFAPAWVLLALIGGSVLLARLTLRQLRAHRIRLNPQSLDGLSALVLALMVVGLMSALHSPGSTWADVAQMLLLAVVVNVGFQCVGALFARFMNQALPRRTASAVLCGNRNIALFLTALPSMQMEPLLLFVACYQVPMYLTPLIGEYVYRRLE